MNDRIAKTREAVVARLLNERNSAGVWEGELSSSALSTATAVTALELVGRETEATPTDRALVLGRDTELRDEYEGSGRDVGENTTQRGAGNKRIAHEIRVFEQRYVTLDDAAQTRQLLWDRMCFRQ